MRQLALAFCLALMCLVSASAQVPDENSSDAEWLRFANEQPAIWIEGRWTAEDQRRFESRWHVTPKTAPRTRGGRREGSALDTRTPRSVSMRYQWTARNAIEASRSSADSIGGERRAAKSPDANYSPVPQVVVPNEDSTDSGGAVEPDEYVAYHSPAPTAEELRSEAERISATIAALGPESSAARAALEERLELVMTELESRPDRARSLAPPELVRRLYVRDVLANGYMPDKATVVAEEMTAARSALDAAVAKLPYGLETERRELLRGLSEARSPLSDVAATAFTYEAARRTGLAPVEIEAGHEISFFDRYLDHLTDLVALHGEKVYEDDEALYEFSALARYRLRQEEAEHEFVSVFHWLDGKETRGFAKIPHNAVLRNPEFREWLKAKSHPWTQLVLDARGSGWRIHRALAANEDQLNRGHAAFTSTFGPFGAGVSKALGGDLEDQIAAAQLAETVSGFATRRTRGRGSAPSVTASRSPTRQSTKAAAPPMPSAAKPSAAVNGAGKSSPTMTNPTGSMKNCVRCTAATVRNICDRNSPLSSNWWTADKVGARFDIPSTVTGNRQLVRGEALAYIRKSLPPGYSMPFAGMPATKITRPGIYVAINAESPQGHAFAVRAVTENGVVRLKMIDDQAKGRIGSDLTPDALLYNSSFYPVQDANRKPLDLPSTGQ